MKKLSKIKIIAPAALLGINIWGLTSLEKNKQENIDTNIGDKNFSSRESEADSSEDSGIDNVDEQDSGNWYEKRILLKKAGPKRAKISKKVAALTHGASAFIEKRNAEEAMVKQELLDFGFTVTYLDEQINNLSKEIDETRKKEGLNEQERSALDEVVKDKADLDQLKSDVDLISQLDGSVGKAIEKLMQQIEVASGYEQKALELYDAIADVLDDKKAKSYYLQIETLLDNVEAIERYINTQFSSYIDSSINTIKESIEKVKTSTKTLQERGLIVTKQFEEAQKAEQERIAKEKAAKKAVASKSWFSGVTDFMMQIFSWVAYPFVWLYSLIFGSK